jgi:hypothetical protein
MHGFHAIELPNDIEPAIYGGSAASHLIDGTWTLRRNVQVPMTLARAPADDRQRRETPPTLTPSVPTDHAARPRSTSALNASHIGGSPQTTPRAATNAAR